MIVPEFKHLRKEQLKKRIKILHVLIYASAAIGIASFVVFFLTHYKYNWSWLLIGLTYILLSVNFVGTIRRMRKEIRKREDRLSQKDKLNAGN
jgi:ABC-type thiamin/hydroxymethylpyrimidine transport system permease subunit